MAWKFFMYEKYVCGGGRRAGRTDPFLVTLIFLRYKKKTEMNSVYYQQDLEKGWIQVIRKIGL